jgi:hypothetical protein
LAALKPEVAAVDTGSDQTLQLDESGEIKAGTEERLVAALYKDSEKMKTTTTEYANVFVLTYRMFVSPKRVFELLSQDYQHHTNSAHCKDPKHAQMYRLRIGNFLKKWVTEAFHDFDETLQNSYLQFVTESIAKHDSTLAISLTQAMHGKQKSGDQRRSATVMFSEAPPKSLIKTQKIVSILDLDPLELARQMTLMDYDICKRIQAKEFLGLAWTKRDKDQRCPNLMLMISRFNLVSRWLAWLIVNEDVVARRTKILSTCVKICKHLYELNNFNAVFQVVGGLGNASVYRLAKTSAGLKASHQNDLEIHPWSAELGQLPQTHSRDQPAVHPVLGCLPDRSDLCRGGQSRQVLRRALELPQVSHDRQCDLRDPAVPAETVQSPAGRRHPGLASKVPGARQGEGGRHSAVQPVVGSGAARRVDYRRGSGGKGGCVWIGC